MSPSPIRSDSWPSTEARHAGRCRLLPDLAPGREELDDRRVATPSPYQGGARTFGTLALVDATLLTGRRRGRSAAPAPSPWSTTRPRPSRRPPRRPPPSPAGAASRLHYYWHDHRAPARPLAHEPPHGAAHLLLEQFDVARAGGEGGLDGFG